MSGMFIAYQFLAFTPDFAECFAHSPAYYVGLLMANSRRSTRDFIIFGILPPNCLIYVCRNSFHDIFSLFSNAVTTCYGLFAHNERRSVYPWRNFSLLLITSNPTMDTLLRGHTQSPSDHWGQSRETSIPIQLLPPS